MEMHKFTVGDRVVVRVSKANWNVRPGIYEIIRALPETSIGRQDTAPRTCSTPMSACSTRPSSRRPDAP